MPTLVDLRRTAFEAGGRLGRTVRAAYAEPFVREAAPPGMLRRRRLLIICSALLAAAAFLFALQALRMRGMMTPISAVLLLGGGLALTYPLLRHYTGSSRAPGLALVLEYVALTALVVFHGNGFHGAALLWAPVAPLLAAYLVSHRAGFATAGLVVAELAVIYGLDRAGYPFPDLFSQAELAWLHLLGLSTVAVFLAFVGWMYESQTISALQRLNGSLREREASYRGLFDSVNDAIYVQDRDGRFLDVNPAMLAMYGYRREELIGQTPALLAAPGRTDLGDTARRVRLAFEGVPQRFDWWGRRQNGEVFPKAVALHRGTYFGQEVVIATARDITERVRHEDALRAAKEKAEEMNRLKDAFLANMSHEFRTPLTTVLGYTQILAEEVPADLREPVDMIERGGRRLMDTLNAVLDLSLFEAQAQARAQQPDVQAERIDAMAVVERAAARFRKEASEKGLTLDVHGPGRPLPVLLADDHLHRILHHLLSNAVKFTEQGGVAVRVHADGALLFLSVEDTGIGISDAFLPHLFEAFKQESDGLQRTYEGAGLGLTLTRHLVDLLDGTIAVTSEKGAGCTFHVTLPAPGAPGPARRPAAARGTRPHTTPA